MFLKNHKIIKHSKTGRQGGIVTGGGRVLGGGITGVGGLTGGNIQVVNAPESSVLHY